MSEDDEIKEVAEFSRFSTRFDFVDQLELEEAEEAAFENRMYAIHLNEELRNGHILQTFT